MRDAASQNTIDTTNLLSFFLCEPINKPRCCENNPWLPVLFPSYTQLSPRLTLFSFPPRVSQQHAGIHGTQHVFQLAMCLCFTPRPSAYTPYLPLACIRLQYWIVEAKTRAKVNGIMALQGNSMGKNAVSSGPSCHASTISTPSLASSRSLTITNGSLLPACNFFPFLPACDTAKWP